MKNNEVDRKRFQPGKFYKLDAVTRFKAPYMRDMYLNVADALLDHTALCTGEKLFLDKVYSVQQHLKGNVFQYKGKPRMYTVMDDGCIGRSVHREDCLVLHKGRWI